MNFFRNNFFLIFFISIVFFGCVSTPETNSQNDDLLTLVSENRLSEVKALFASREDANQRNSNGETALHIAAKQNSSEMAALIITVQDDIDAVDLSGRTPLVTAMEAEAYNVAELLVKNGAYVFSKNPEGLSAFEIALNSNDKEKSLDAIIKPKSVIQKNENGQSILHIASKKLSKEAVKLILSNKVEIDLRDKAGNAPLFYAYQNPKNDDAPYIAEMLIKAGASPLRREFEYFENAILRSNMALRLVDGQTPLHYAAALGHDGFVQFFLDKGADPQVKDIASSTPLHQAVRAGNMNCAKKLLKAGAYVDASDANGNTPLHLVMPLDKRIDGVNLLLSFKADPNAKDSYGDTPLHIASSIGMDISVLTSLVEAGGDVNNRNKEGITPFAIAIDRQRMHHIVLYINHGADIHAEDISGVTPLERALHSNAEVLAAILPKDKINSRDSKGNTPLHIAVETLASKEYIEMIISQGADLNAQNQTGDTPLHCAVRNNNRIAGELLLAKNADVFVTNVSGESPLNIALKRGQGRQDWILTSRVITSSDGAGNTPLHFTAGWQLDDSVSYIIQKGGNPDARNSSGETPLFNAVKTDSPSTVRILLQNKANPNARDYLGNTPLHTAVRWSAEKSARILLQMGTDPNAANLGGKTPLHEASRTGKKALVSMIIAGGADSNSTDETGKTPLIEAVAANRQDVVTVLLKSGASPVLQDMTGRGPLHYAVSTGEASLVSLIRNAGSNPLARDTFGNTPFSLALSENPEFALSVLGSDRQIADSDGNTPIHIAVMVQAKEEMVQVLINKAFPINRRNRDGASPLLLAVKNGRQDLVKLITVAGGDPYLADQKGDCAISVALEENWDSVVTIVRAAGNKVDTTGNGILHYAAMKGSDNAITQLLALGLDKNIKNVAGETPFDVAKRWHRESATKLLQ